MADWRWEPFQDDLLDGLPDAARAETERLADEIAVRESMVFLEGSAYTGPGPGPGVRGERIVARAGRSSGYCHTSVATRWKLPPRIAVAAAWGYPRASSASSRLSRSSGGMKLIGPQRV